MIADITIHLQTEKIWFTIGYLLGIPMGAILIHSIRRWKDSK